MISNMTKKSCTVVETHVHMPKGVWAPPTFSDPLRSICCLNTLSGLACISNMMASVRSYTNLHYSTSQWHSHPHKRLLKYRDQLKWEECHKTSRAKTHTHTSPWVHRQEGRGQRSTALWIHSSGVWCQKPCRVFPHKTVGWQREIEVKFGYIFQYFF